MLGQSGPVEQLKKRLAERMLSAELGRHWSWEREQVQDGELSNHRNGTGAKTVLTPSDPLALEIPRDRQTTFDPVLVAKHQRRPAASIGTVKLKHPLGQVDAENVDFHGRSAYENG